MKKYLALPIVTCTLLLAQSRPGSPANTNNVAAPKTMRLCIAPTACANLTWTGDHYDGRGDNETTVSSRYWITLWSTEKVVLYGITAKPVDGVNAAEGVFHGKISSAGNSLENAQDDWHIGKAKSGTMPFTLSWGSGLTSAAPAKPTIPTPPKSSSPTTPNPALLADGCPKDESSAPAGDAFDMFLTAKRMQTEATDHSAVLEAIKLYCKAAKAGSGEAAFEIGEIYLNTGFGLPGKQGPFGMHYDDVPVDVNKALFWYKKAAAAGDTQGKVKVAFFQRHGNGVYWRSGDYASVSEEPKNVSSSMDILQKTANAGDSEALVDLIDIYSKDAEGTIGSQEEREVRIKAWEVAEAISLAKVSLKCNSPEILTQIMEQTPDRTITKVIGAEAHGNSFVCLAALSKEEGENSTIGGLVALLGGKPLSNWIYNLYRRNANAPFEVVRASVNQEYMRRLNQAVQRAAEINNK